MSLPYFFLKGTSGVGERGGGGEGLPYKSDGDARCLAYGGQLQNLVSLRVFGDEKSLYWPIYIPSVLDVCFSMVSFRKGVILSLSHTHIGVP